MRSRRKRGRWASWTRLGGYYPAYLDLVRRTLPRLPRTGSYRSGTGGIHQSGSTQPGAAEKILDRELTRLDKLHKAKGDPLEGSVW